MKQQELQSSLPQVENLAAKALAEGAPAFRRDFDHLQNASSSGWKTGADGGIDSARIWQLQLTLAPQTPRDVCERMGLNWLAATQLHVDGLLSFDPRALTTLNEAQEAELRLVGPFVVSGFDTELLARVLHGLRRPYQYRPGSIYLDWEASRWRLIPVAEAPDPRCILNDWLESLKEEGNREGLEEIARDVAVALKVLRPG